MFFCQSFYICCISFFFFFKQKTAYEMRISDWSSDVCSSDLIKATWLDNRLRTNIAGFHTWKSDNQAVVNAVVPGVGVTKFIQNNGSTSVWGAEFEVIAVPCEGMEITSSLSLIEGKYKNRKTVVEGKRLSV